MAQLVLIGVDAQELHWLRVLVALRRHPDPGVPMLARQALVYLTEAAARRTPISTEPLDHAG
jgi:hypothetical protein